MRIFIGNNTYNDWSPDVDEYDREKQQHHVGDTVYVVRTVTDRGKTSYDFGGPAHDHGVSINGITLYNEGEHTITAIDGQYAVCE